MPFVTPWKPLPENEQERAAFDDSANTICDGDRLKWVAIALANWAIMERQIHPGGSFGEQLAIMANEVAAAVSVQS